MQLMVQSLQNLTHVWRQKSIIGLQIWRCLLDPQQLDLRVLHARKAAFEIQSTAFVVKKNKLSKQRQALASSPVQCTGSKKRGSLYRGQGSFTSLLRPQ